MRASWIGSAWLGLACAALPLLLAAPPAAASTAMIYVTNSAGDSVMVIDPTKNKVVQEIKGIEIPHGVNFSPDGSKVYISNETERVLDVVDRKSGKIIGTAKLSGHPNNIAVTKDGARVVVCIADNPAALDLVDTKTLTVKSIPMKSAMHNVYVTPDGKYAVGGSVRGKFLVVVDLATDQIAWTINYDQGVRPIAIEAGPDGSTSRLFVQLSNLNGFSVVDFNKHDEVTRIKHPDDGNGYGVEERRTDTPSHGIAIAPDGKSLWVTSVLSNAVFAYSLPDLKLIGRVILPDEKIAGRHPLGALPDWLAFTPDGKRVYVSDSGIRKVSAIDTASMKVVATIPVGEVPKRMNTLVLR